MLVYSVIIYRVIFKWNHLLSMLPSVPPSILRSRYAERSLALSWKTGRRLRMFCVEKGPSNTMYKHPLTLPDYSQDTDGETCLLENAAADDARLQR